MEGTWYCFRPTLLVRIHSSESMYIEFSWMAGSNFKHLIDLLIKTGTQKVTSQIKWGWKVRTSLMNRKVSMGPGCCANCPSAWLRDPADKIAVLKCLGRIRMKNHSKTFRIFEQLFFVTQVSGAETECFNVCQKVTMGLELPYKMCVDWPTKPHILGASATHPRQVEGQYMPLGTFGVMNNSLRPVDRSNLMRTGKCFQQMVLSQLDIHVQKCSFRPISHAMANINSMDHTDTNMTLSEKN